MKRTHIALVALLITALATPIATAQAGPETSATPEATGTTNETARTTSTATAGPVEQARTDVEEQARTPIPTPPPDSEFARDRGSDTNQSEPERGERIESGLILLNSSYSSGSGSGSADVPGEWGTITLTFEASQTTAITLYDAGSFILGGQSHDRVLDPFEGTKTFEFRAYKPENSEYVGVTIQTAKTRYNEPIEVESAANVELPQIPTLAAILTGIVAVVIAMLALDHYLDLRDSHGVIRVE